MDTGCKPAGMTGGLMRIWLLIIKPGGNMECLYCKGKMVKGSAPFSADRNGYHISWESVPAWICSQCGEALFEENEVNHIQKALQQVDNETIGLKSNIA